MPQIVAIAGSPSHPSRSYAVLESSREVLARQGIPLTLIQVRDLPAEALIYGQFDHPAIVTAAAQVTAASAVIISTPIYKAAYTGLLKTFLDLLPQKALVNKPILPIATGGTLAHLLAIDYALNPVLGVLGATQIRPGLYLVDSQFQRRADQGVEFLDPDLEERFATALAGLVAALPVPVPSP